jgi:hypothetical protein
VPLAFLGLGTASVWSWSLHYLVQLRRTYHPATSDRNRAPALCATVSQGYRSGKGWRRLDCNHLAALGINADVQLAPGSAARRAVLFNQPLTASAKFQAGAVNQEMHRPSPAPAQWRDMQGFASAALSNNPAH